MNEKESYNECMHKFIDMANEMKEQGHDASLVSAALMTSSSVYATFVSVGNTGGLEPSGVDKIVDVYRLNLERIQEQRKAADEAQKAEADEAEKVEDEE